MQIPSKLKDQFWGWATRTNLLISIGTAILSTGVFAWLAQRWTEVTGGSWPASIFIGIGAVCAITLVGSVALVAYRYFRPLPPSPTAAQKTIEQRSVANPQTEHDVLLLIHYAVYQSTVLMLDDLLRVAPDGIDEGPLQLGGDFAVKNAASQDFIELIRRKMDPGSHRRSNFENVMHDASVTAEHQVEQTPIEQRPKGVDPLALRRWAIAHTQCARAIAFLQSQRQEAEQILLNERFRLLERYRDRSPS